MDLVNKYVRTDFTSHEDFTENFDINMPDNFNFGYDVVDELAEKTPDAKAMIWCNDHGEEHVFTFRDMKYYSDKTANYFRSLGIKKGDFVMLILKRHYQFWFCMVALHKIGAVTIPATHLLTKKDIVYRCNAADITTIIATGDGDVPEHVDSAASGLPYAAKPHFCTCGGERRHAGRLAGLWQRNGSCQRRFCPPGGRGGDTDQRHDADVFYLRHDRAAENGRA